MRKFLLTVTCLSILAVMVAPMALGQIIVGDTSCTTTCSSIPVDPYYNYTESQYIIPDTAMAAAGIVATDQFTDMGWYLCAENVDAADHMIQVYLSELPAGAYPPVCTAPEPAGILVYTGPLGNCSPVGCCTVTLDIPYTYNGGNLIVAVCDVQSGYSAGSSRAWAANADPGNGLYRRNDSSGAYDCDPTTNEFGSEGCCDSWTTTCFILAGAAATPTPTVTPTNTPGPQGGDCSNPVLVTQGDLPYMVTGGTNCGLGDIYDGTCLGYYDSGEEIIYQLDLATAENIMITMDPGPTTYSGIAIHDACPLDPTTCIEVVTASSATPRVTSCLALAAGTYFIQIDTWSSPDCIPAFDLTIETCTFVTPTPTPTATPTFAPPAGDTCMDAVSIACGDCVNGYTFSAADDHDCGTGHAGVDVVYEFVLASDSTVTFVGEATFDADWTIATACDASTGDILCVDYEGTAAVPSCSTTGSPSAGGRLNFTQFLTAGTYYIWVDGYFASSAGEYSLEISCVTGPTPTPTSTPTAPPGGSCGDPLIVDQAALPFTETNTNCGLTDAYDATCLGNYDGGEDIIYQLNLTADTGIQVTLDPGTTTWTGLVLDSNCPPDATTCIATSTNSSASAHSLDCTQLTAGTYYIMVDTYPSPDCIPSFDITIEECVAPTATPTPIVYDLIVTAPTNGNVYPPADTYSDITPGTVVDLIANGVCGYQFDHWVGNVADPNAAVTSITVNADETVEAVFVATGDAVFFGDDFETCDLAGWTLYDEDGDTYNWEGLDLTTGIRTYTGSCNASSASWVPYVALTPDNYLVSPQVDLTNATAATLNWYVTGQDQSYPAEQYTVLVSTTGNAVVDFTDTVHTETVAAAGPDGNFYWARSVDLTSYAGQSIYVAFRHYGSTDEFRLNIDDVCISGTEDTGPTPTPEPIPATGPAGIGLLLLAVGGLMSLAGIRRRK